MSVKLIEIATTTHFITLCECQLTLVGCACGLTMTCNLIHPFGQDWDDFLLQRCQVKMPFLCRHIYPICHFALDDKRSPWYEFPYHSFFLPSSSHIDPPHVMFSTLCKAIFSPHSSLLSMITYRREIELNPTVCSINENFHDIMFLCANMQSNCLSIHRNNWTSTCLYV